MINKFKNALKVGKKNKEVEAELNNGLEAGREEAGSSESSSEKVSADIEGVSQEETTVDSAENQTDTESTTDGSSAVNSQEDKCDKVEDDQIESNKIDVEPVESSFKVESVKGKSVEEGIPVDERNVQEMVCSTLKQFAPMIIKKGIRLELEGLDTGITTNEEVLLFIFQEILSNAVNSLSEGSIKIYLEDEKLIFEDTGYGIPAEEVPLIFNEGFMASNAVPSDDLEGMGMYKCSIALEKMNYGYEIKSTEGKGTTFIIDLSK